MVDYVPGCAMLVRRSVFEAIGLFDERLFMYFEDADLCRRAIEAGFGIACVVSAKLWHKVSQSAVRMKVVVRYQLARNRLLFFRRYAHGPSRALTDVYLIADGLIRIVRAVCAGSKEAALADWRGLVDGWRLSVDELREA